jgi:hypothetical protein
MVIRLLLGAGLAVAAFSTAGASTPVEAPTPPVVEVQIGSVKPVQTVAPTTTTTTISTVPVFTPDPEALCPEWHETALEAGWDEDQLPRVDYIMWRESRCLTEAFSQTDPNGGSHGLMQINGFWCRPSKYHSDGWLQEQSVLNACTDLYDPLTNLTAARTIWDYAEARGCGWGPWTTRNTRWC